MESLYTKYRPQTFADVVGQTHVVTTLEHAVIEGRTSHAYLFCGPRGTGKTTMARLLAKALMCEQGEGHLPDGTCDQCRMIAAGEHPDVYELDAASRTGVDNVRDEIISRVSFAPVQAPYKMYIIDEVHMLTTAAFNALLKTLEEPPAHVVFVLCTTDPQKIPETILSRVQRFDFHAISNADIQGRLAYICEREGFGYDPEALELVVRHARGGMRDAISELEQLSVSGGGSITVDVARDVLGEVSASTLERIGLAMANRDVPTLFAQVESLVEVGRDLLQFTRALTARLRDVYVVAAVGVSADIVAASDDELPAISREARAFGSVDRIARALALLSDASTEMRVAPNQRLVLEVALTKIARPQSELTLESLADRVATLEKQIVALSMMETRRSTEVPKASGERRERSGASSQQSTDGVADIGNQRPEAAAHAEREATAAGAPVNVADTQQTAPADARAASANRSHTQAANKAAGLVNLQGSHAAPATSAYATAPSRQSTQGAARTDGATAFAQQARAAMGGTPYGTVGSEESRVVSDEPAKTSEARFPRSAASGEGQAPRVTQAVSRHAPAAAQSAPAPQKAQEQAPQGVPSAQSPATTDQGELQRRWKQVVDGLLASHPQHGSLLMSSTIVADDGMQLTVSFPKGSLFACKMLDRPDVRANVDPMIAQVFGPRKTHFAEGAKAPAPQPVASAASPAQHANASVPLAGSRPAPEHANASVPLTSNAPSEQSRPPYLAPWEEAPVSASSTQAASVQAGPVVVASPLPTQQSEPQGAAWNAPSLDDDMVPYDDFDASPYEEEFAFGDVPESVSQGYAATPAAPQPVTGWQASSAPAGGMASASRAGISQQASARVPWQTAAGTSPSPTQPDAWEAANSGTTPTSDQSGPVETSSTQTPALGSSGGPAPTLSVAPSRASIATDMPSNAASSPTAAVVTDAGVAPTAMVPPEPSSAVPAPGSDSAPAQQDAAPAPEKPKRTRHPAAAIPADIITMMAEIFGEGVTYTSLEPDDQEDEVEEELSDEASTESEFVDEPMDDADYDEDE